MSIDFFTLLARKLKDDEIARCKAMPYQEYLRSAWWQFVHHRTLKRAHGKCELCRQRTAREAHHTTYVRIGEELPDDMVALCRHCHQHITDNGLHKLSRRDLLRRRQEIMHSPEYQRAKYQRLEY